MACPCCNPPNPCSVLVDGERVPFSSFNPYEVITAQWRGLQAPGSDRTFIDGVLFSDNPSISTDSLQYVTRGGCDGAGQINDSKVLFIATAYSGYINACWTSEALSNYQTFVAVRVNDTTCRLYGGIGTLKVFSACLIDGVPSGDSVAEENWWLWECLVVNGVPGNVTVSPSIGARYFNSDPVVCGVNHEAPVVTLDFVP